jgi:hypothetical protein
MVAAGSHRREVRVWSAATGRELLRLPSHGWFSCVTFAPDGRRLVTAGSDTTALVWDLSALKPAPDLPAQELTDAELERTWAALGGEDAAGAYQAAWILVRAPGQTVTFLKGRLRAVRKGEVLDASEERLRNLVADLDDDRFAVREAASAELGKLGGSAGAALRRALAANPSAEVRARVERLLAALERQWTLGQEGELIRTVRAIRVLEQVGTDEACAVLRELAAGWPPARETREAKAALERTAKRIRP